MTSVDGKRAASGLRGHSTEVDALGGSQSIATIRDILFGREMETFAERLSALEQRVVSESAELRAALSSRLDELERRLATEEEARSHGLGSAAKEMHHAVGTMTAATEGLRRQLASEAGRLEAAFEQRLAELAATLTAEAGSLRDEKASRSGLAQLLRQLADNLAAEPEPAKRSKSSRR